MKGLLFFICLLASLATRAQSNAAMAERQHRHVYAKTTNVSTLEDAYDIHHVKLDISLNNTTTYVAGNANTTATVAVATGMIQYAFELDSLLTIDSLFINGQQLTATQSGFLRTVTLGSTLALGSTFTAQVFYHGTTPAGTNFFSHGLDHSQLPSGSYITYTMSDPYLAKDWWPCKQSLLDKIDSVDIWVTVPDSLKAGCNGLLTAVTPMPGNQARYEWKTRYPIDYYLISASVAPYVDHSMMLHFTGSADSMPIQQFIYDTATFMPQHGAAVDSVGYMVDYISQLYGRYPFWKEKYGHCIAPLSGGMEHQTMTTLGAYTTPLICHELGHQWWGDCVTYSSWRDIWLSEGWASYTEQLFVEHFWGDSAARAYRTGVFNDVLTSIGGSTYVDDTANVNRIFDSRLTYNKGAAIAHMLRFSINNDSLCFAALRAYLQQYRYGNATTEDFKHSIEQTTGMALDTFFNQWVYGQGYPKYNVRWNQTGQEVTVRLAQGASLYSVTPRFATPVEIALRSNAGDTLIRVYNSDSLQTYTFTWGNTVTAVAIDPLRNILERTFFNQHDTTLGIPDAAWAVAITIAPNPARDTWHVANIPPHTTLHLTDGAGHIVWQQRNVTGSIDIPAQPLAPGTYYLQLSQLGSGSVTRKLAAVK